MAGQVAQNAEVVHGSDDASTEQVMPQPVDLDARQERIAGRVDYLLGQFQPTAALADSRFFSAGQCLKESAWHDIPWRLVRAANEDLFIDAAAVPHGRGQMRFPFEFRGKLGLFGQPRGQSAGDFVLNTDEVPMREQPICQPRVSGLPGSWFFHHFQE